MRLTARRVEITCWAIAIAVGGLQAWAYRFDASSEDSISYLDLSDAVVDGSWHSLINAYWSPLYPFLIGVIRRAVGASARLELPLVKVVNLLLLIGALAAFAFFLRRLLAFAERAGSTDHEAISESLRCSATLAGYSLFLWSALMWIGVHADVPELAVSALTYVAAGLLLDLARTASWRMAMGLGVVLGLAFLAKEVMLPVGLAFLIAALWFSRRRTQIGITAGTALVVVAAPYVWALSLQVHRPTVGESGRLNYAWYVAPRLPDHHWQGEGGRPVHATRPISTEPSAFEFASPIGGTYPPWYDPTYWNEGMPVQPGLWPQARVIVANAGYYGELFLGGAWLGWVVLAAVGGRARAWLVDIWRHPTFAPASAALALLLVATDFSALLRSDARLVAPFVVVWCASVFLARAPRPVVERAARGLALAFAGWVVMGLARPVADNVRVAVAGKSSEALDVAAGLATLGLCPGDAVAHLGFKNYAWARLARLRIAAEVPNANAFWRADPTTRARVLAALEAAGAKAVVQRPGFALPPDALTAGWQPVGNASTYVLLFNPHACSTKQIR